MFSTRRFPLKRKYFSNSWNEGFLKKIRFRKKAYGFYYPENPGMKYSLKNTFPLYGKTASFGKKIENDFQ